MSMLERLPTVDEMISALSSPIVPEESTSSAGPVDELGVEDMIREMFVMMKESQSSQSVQSVPPVADGGF